jgi:uncharacterized protein involved in exopolysaccharide biosynthesis
MVRERTDEMIPQASAFELMLRFFRILARRKLLILSFTFVATAITIVAVLVVDSEYKAVGLVKPPKGSGGAGIEDLLKESGGAMGGLLGSFIGGGESGQDECLSILGSTRFAMLVIERYDLETAWEFRKPGKKPKKYYLADVLRKFEKKRGFQVTDENAIEISMEDKSPERAKEMVDYMVRILDSLYIDVQRREMRQKLQYLDRRMEMAENDMKRIEDSLVAFKNKYNLYLPELQVQLILESAAQTELEIETIKEDMELEAALRGTASSKYRDLSVKRNLLKKSMAGKLKNTLDSNSLVLPARALSTLALEYFRLDRTYKVKLGLFKYLTQQIESLKLEAEKNTQVISLLDPPWVNDKRVFPKRRVMVQAAFVLSLIFSSLLAVLLAVWERHRTEKTLSHSLATEIRRELFRIR